MKARQMEQLGVPQFVIPVAMSCIGKAVQVETEISLPDQVRLVVSNPQRVKEGDPWRPLADALIGYSKKLKDYDEQAQELSPVKFFVNDEIPQDLAGQIRNARSLPVTHSVALMPDCHLGYGVPIGCVLATKDAVVPNAVGVDIGCRMKLSVFDVDPDLVENKRDHLTKILIKNTAFGKGSQQDQRTDHRILSDPRWDSFSLLKNLKDRAASQLGSSGGGNHFVEFGIIEPDESSDWLESGKRYLALLTHSGSRGPGAATADHFHRIAKDRLHPIFNEYSDLAWLEMDSEPGQQYWLAMNLMGDYASANHDVIHNLVRRALGARIVTEIENHHNFAWREAHGDEMLYVHRKGATPAGSGVSGIIPGTMASPGFVVRGRGNPDSLQSASHGAGRRLSRKAAKEQLSIVESYKQLENAGVTLTSGISLDEMPGAYKDIESVMSQQADLVDVLGRFYPKIVRMAGGIDK